MARFRGLDELFEGRHFDGEIIVLCVRWYLRFKLSFRDLVEMMAEHGLPWRLSGAETTSGGRPGLRGASMRPTWKIRGKWVDLYRAVDRDRGDIQCQIGFFLL